MSLWQIALRNVWQSRGRYLAYLGAAAFAVMIYFLYSALQLHPGLQGGYLGAGYVLEGMKGSTVVIGAFTFLFLLYSNSAFVRSRMKEFGLLTLLGLSRGQLVRLILLESLLVGAVAVAAGMGAGLLFAKLFFMAISAVLRLPGQIPVYLGPPVWLQTLTVFGSFFVLVSLASLRGVLRRQVIDLVRAGRQPKGAPAFSALLALLGLLLVAGGYAWAAVPQVGVVLLGVVPVTAIVSLGTYLLMRQASVAFLTWLHRWARFFYRPVPFLSVSQLVYKLQDNYRVLSAVALLIAVILTAMGTIFTLYMVVTNQTLERHPHALQLEGPGDAGLSPLVGRVEAALAQYGVRDLQHQQVVGLAGVRQSTGEAVTVLPYSFYAGTARIAGEVRPLPGPDGAIAVSPAAPLVTLGQDPEPAQPDQLLVGGQTLAIEVVTDQSGPLLNAGGSRSWVLVLADDRLAQLLAAAPPEQQVSLTFWNGAGWRSRALQQAVAELRASGFPAGVVFTAALEPYYRAVSGMGLMLFVGAFISLVFFAATFSLLYFRLFTEIDEDRRYVLRLEQLGVGRRVLQRLALGQAAVIFFIPFVVGLLHATFAMKALGTLVSRTVLHYGWGVALVYLAFYALAFGATYAAYWRSLQAGLGGREGLAG